jgi:hypothetical protein
MARKAGQPMITEQTTAEPIAVEPITTHPATADR